MPEKDRAGNNRNKKKTKRFFFIADLPLLSFDPFHPVHRDFKFRSDSTNRDFQSKIHPRMDSLPGSWISPIFLVALAIFFTDENKRTSHDFGHAFGLGSLRILRLEIFELFRIEIYGSDVLVVLMT